MIEAPAGGLAGLGPPRPRAASRASALAFPVAPVALALFVSIGGFKAASWMGFMPIDATVASGLILAVVVAWRALRSGVPGVSGTALLPLALAGLVLASVAWSPDPGAGFTKALEFVFLTLPAYLSAFVLIRSRADLVSLMVGLVAFGLVVALSAEPTGNPIKPLTVAGGNLTNQIDLALYSAIGLFAALYLATTRRGMIRVFGIASVPVLGYVLFAAGSRGVLAASVLALLYVGWVYATKFSRVIPVLIGLAVIVTAAVIIPSLAGEATQRYQDSLHVNSADSLLGQRTYIFDRAADLALESPWGIGSAGYPAVTHGLVYPHNLELELAVEYGIAAAFTMVAILGCAWVARRRALTGELAGEAVFVGALFIVLFVDAQVSHGLNGSRPLWLVLALCFVLARLASDWPRASPDRALERSRIPAFG